MDVVKQQQTQLWSKDFVLISWANFFLCFSYHMVATTLPVFVMAMDGGEFAAGLIVGVVTITALLIRPFVGSVLDSLGRKTILMFGLAIFAVTVISYEWLRSLGLLFLSRAVQGVGWGISSTALGTIVSDIIAPTKRAEGIGYFGISINVSMALAPVTGIWLKQAHGFTVLFFVATLSVALSMSIVPFIRSSPAPIAARKPLIASTLLERKALYPSLLILFVTFTYGGIISSLTLFGQEAGIPNVGPFFLACAIVLVIVRTIAGKIADRKGYAYVLMPGVIATSTGLLLLSFAQDVFSLIIAAIFYGLGFGAIQPTMQAWTINRVSPERRGAATGTYLSAFDLGIGAGAILLGLLAEWTGYAAIYRISIVCMLLFALVFGLNWLRERKRLKWKQSV